MTSRIGSLLINFKNSTRINTKADQLPPRPKTNLIGASYFTLFAKGIKARCAGSRNRKEVDMIGE